jgi:site-specific DNA-methyltransferase (adenine-specific)
MFGIGRPGRIYKEENRGASRFFYCAKASKSERNAGLEGMPEKEKKTLNDYANPSEGRTASKSGSAMANHHPTVKPVKLMEYLVRMVTPPGGVVLDPFMGSGTTGVAAKNLGFEFIGIEREPQYAEIAEKRIAAAGNVVPIKDEVEEQLEMPA